MVQRPQGIEMWLDPGCPFTWRTSRWLAGVAAALEIPVRWRLMSLAVLNEGKEIPARFRDAAAASWQPIRLLAAAEELGGSAALASLYAELGRLRHEEGRDLDDTTVREALEAASLPRELAAARTDDRYDEAIRRSHAEAQARVGTESGSPVIAVDGGRGFFGPVITDVPTREDGLRLLKALTSLSSIPSFSELKRAR